MSSTGFIAELALRRGATNAWGSFGEQTAKGSAALMKKVKIEYNHWENEIENYLIIQITA